MGIELLTALLIAAVSLIAAAVSVIAVAVSLAAVVGNTPLNLK